MPLGCTSLRGGGGEQQESVEGGREPGTSSGGALSPGRQVMGPPGSAESPQPESPKLWWVLTLVEHLPRARHCPKRRINVHTQPTLTQPQKETAILPRWTGQYGAGSPGSSSRALSREHLPWGHSRHKAPPPSFASYKHRAHPHATSRHTRRPLVCKAYIMNAREALGGLQDFSGRWRIYFNLYFKL